MHSMSDFCGKLLKLFMLYNVQHWGECLSRVVESVLFLVSGFLFFD